MSYCPKCGNKVDDSMTFCPKCGASLKAAPSQPAPPPAYRNEKQEKREKGEKGEKHEKGEFGYVGWLIGGIIVILIGFFGFAQAENWITGPMNGAIVLLVIGVVIIAVAVWLSTTARRRMPQPPT